MSALRFRRIKILFSNDAKRGQSLLIPYGSVRIILDELLISRRCSSICSGCASVIRQSMLEAVPVTPSFRLPLNHVPQAGY